MPQNSRLFDLYAATADQKVQANKELVERKLRRSYASALDSLEVQVIEGKATLRDLHLNFVNPDFTAMTSKRSSIAAAEKAIENLKASYLEVFGEELAS